MKILTKIELTEEELKELLAKNFNLHRDNNLSLRIEHYKGGLFTYTNIILEGVPK